MPAPFACVSNAWSRHRGEIRAYLLHRLGDAGIADDVVQEVFLKAMRAGETFCSLGNPRAWLFQVARNALVDRLRAGKQTEPVSDDLAAESYAIAPVDALAECVEGVLAELPSDDREIIRRCDIEGIKLQAFADASGLTLAAAKSRLLRARQRMRDVMTRHCQVRFDEAGHVCCHVRQPGC
jgi:RNA polymerase sigma-70 factor (ECF subfamily)